MNGSFLYSTRFCWINLWFLFVLLSLLVQATVSPVASPSTQPAVGSGSVYGITQLSPSAPAYTGAYQPIPTTIGPSSSSQKEHSFPERPDQPECQFYMKTGSCKFGSSCRYHHPPLELAAPKTNVLLSPLGLPLRHVSIIWKLLCFVMLYTMARVTCLTSPKIVKCPIKSDLLWRSLKQIFLDNMKLYLFSVM